MLLVAAAHGHDVLVLGTWGCGAFGNDSRQIAGLFAEALAEHENEWAYAASKDLYGPPRRSRAL